MTEKKKNKEHEETQVTADNLADFYGFLGNLLPHTSKLLQETLDKHKETLEQKRPKKPHETKELLELEKEKNNCLRDLLTVAIDQYQRIGAEYINLQKRVPKQISDTITYEKEMIIKSLLPALDNLESALAGHQNAQSIENVDVFVKGVRIIYDHILDILKMHGVEQIKALGEKFDPALHEAILHKTEPEQKDNLVLEEYQKGYKLNGRVIRPSRVIINKLPTEKNEEAESESDLQKQINPEDEAIDTQ